MSPGPLAGCRVLVTRPAHQAAPTVAALEAAGAAVVVEPLIRIEPPADPGPLREAAEGLLEGAYDWAVVTSPNGAAALADVLEQAAGWPPGRGPSGEDGAGTRLRARLCAVGPGTRKALESRGLVVHCVPERAEGAAIPDALQRLEPLAGRRILLALGDRADDRLEAALRARGARPVRVTAYRTLEDPSAARQAAERVRLGAVDLVLVASPSQVAALSGALVQSGAGRGDGEIRAVAIGPTTARAAVQAGWRVTQARSPDPAGLVAACVEAWSATKGSPPRPAGPDDGR
ncbi:uroporphyrinogen-III synthase [Geochorda subterranea]|uniref:Uroporphyrinogen-III synthase n=1 Tax=Geochorda subterranea TaxID=3109564 RepID=A0ABZ1BQ66_9FIRM|nr:uroporphyrinogen-III synthase [Limnochorda sp. LNt]WRP14949.1 uroporphyrinogen-III synthase [Limnochorda sp. LNt]